MRKVEWLAVWSEDYSLLKGGRDLMSGRIYLGQASLVEELMAEAPPCMFIA